MKSVAVLGLNESHLSVVGAGKCGMESEWDMWEGMADGGKLDGSRRKL